MKDLNARWIEYIYKSWLDSETGEATLREDTPEDIKKEYEEYKKQRNMFKNIKL